MTTIYETATGEYQPMVELARGVGPILEEHARDAERERRLSRPALDAMAEAGLFRLLLPRALGGFEVDPVTCARVVEEVSGFDTAAGWALQAGNLGAWWSARLPAEGVDEIYADHPSSLMAAAFHPPQQAIEVPGGFRVTGRGPLASNVHDAQWLFLTAMIMDGERPRMTDGTPEIIGLVVRTSEAQVIDTWYSLGMRATDSNDVVVDQLFVPQARTFRLMPSYQPGSRFEGPLYRFPAIGASLMIVAPVPLAAARGALDEVRELARRKTAFGFTKPLRERAVVQTAVAKAEARLRSARLFFYATLGEAWARACTGEGSSLEQKADLLLAGSHLVSTAAAVTDMMHRIAGTSGIYERSPLERHMRDVQTLRHHGFASENRLEAVGQIYLGLPPEFAMVAF